MQYTQPYLPRNFREEIPPDASRSAIKVMAETEEQLEAKGLDDKTWNPYYKIFGLESGALNVLLPIYETEKEEGFREEGIRDAMTTAFFLGVMASDAVWCERELRQQLSEIGRNN